MIVRKIYHRNAFRIGIFFDYNSEKIQLLKKIGASYSTTNKCWYVNYDAPSLNLLKANFDAIVFEKDNQLIALTTLVTGNKSRDLSPTATSAIQLDTPMVLSLIHI
jgi:hypothetical protein